MHRLFRAQLLRASSAAAASACAAFAASDGRAPSLSESGLAGGGLAPAEREYGLDGAPVPGSFASYVSSPPPKLTEAPLPSPPPAFITPSARAPRLVTSLPDPEPDAGARGGRGLGRRDTLGTSRLVLAGDCGGTNTRLQLYRVPAGARPELGGRPPGELLLGKKFVNSDYESFAHVRPRARRPQRVRAESGGRRARARRLLELRAARRRPGLTAPTRHRLAARCRPRAPAPLALARRAQVLATFLEQAAPEMEGKGVEVCCLACAGGIQDNAVRFTNVAAGWVRAAWGGRAASPAAAPPNPPTHPRHRSPVHAPAKRHMCAYRSRRAPLAPIRPPLEPTHGSPRPRRLRPHRAQH